MNTQDGRKFWNFYISYCLLEQVNGIGLFIGYKEVYALDTGNLGDSITLSLTISNWRFSFGYIYRIRRG